jgi:3-deoxy-D-manno-octulosonic-acid transferase
LYDFFILFYSFIIRLASFWNPKAKSWVKGRVQFPEFNSEKKRIWFHCASLGEFEQGRPVLEALKVKFPQYEIVVSFFSPSGYEIRKNYPLADYVIYLPIDTPKNAEKLIQSINPALVIWVKYEYWFHYLRQLKTNNIPVILISGIFRKSQPFFKWYGKFWINILKSFSKVFVQDENSFDLLNGIGINNASLSGDTRFDRVKAIADENKQIPEIAAFTNNQFTIVAGSTWEDDENLIAPFIQNNKSIKFIIAPHEISPSNLNRLKAKLDNAIFYSEWKNNMTSTNQVLIINNIGMLSALYKYASVAFIGGGFNKSGIHNTLEAAVYGKPVFFGPNYQKFAEAVSLVEKGGAFSVKSSSEFNERLTILMQNENKLVEASELSHAFVKSKIGATAIIINYVTENRLLIN